MAMKKATGFVAQAKKQHLSWTVSKLGQYNKCPAQAKFKNLDKLPEPPSPALARGSEIHEAAEMYVAGRMPKLAEELKHPKIKALLDKLKAEYKLKKVRVELELAFTRQWKPCHWLAKDVYVRFKIDCVHFLKDGAVYVIDWKTGKFKPNDPEYDDQLHAYCTAILSTGLAKTAQAALVFTDTGDVVEREGQPLTLAQLPAAQKGWDKKAKPMLADTRHAPRPGNACRWCAYSANKDGPCEF